MAREKFGVCIGKHCEREPGRRCSKERGGKKRRESESRMFGGLKVL